MHKQLRLGTKIVLWLHVAIGMVFGVALMLMPKELMSLYGWPATSPYFPRLFGAALVGFASSSFLAVVGDNWEKSRIIVMGEITWTGMAALVCVWMQVMDELPLLGWVNAGIFGFFAVAFMIMYFIEEDSILYYAQIEEDNSSLEENLQGAVHDGYGQ